MIYTVKGFGIINKSAVDVSRPRISAGGCEGAQTRPRKATPCPRSGAVSESARLQWHRNGREELPHARGQELRLRGATPGPRSGGCAGAGGPRGASYSTFKVRKGGGEEIPLIQGKRNPSKTVGVARGHQSADTLKP